MARFRVGNSAGNPWTGVSPNKTPSNMTDWEADFNASVIDQIESGDFSAGVYPWINVADDTYGADPTGVANSSAAFQAAADSVASESYATILIPVGTYVISTPITVTGKYISWVGMGVNATQLNCATGFLVVNNSGVSTSTKYHPFSIKGMTIASTEVATGATVPTGVAVTYTGEPSQNGVEDYSFVMEDVSFRGKTLSTHSFRKHVVLTNTQRTFFHRCAFLGLNGTHAVTDDPIAKCASFIELNDGCTSCNVMLCRGFEVDKVIHVVDGSSVVEGFRVVHSAFVKVNHGVYATGGTTVNSLYLHDCHISSYLSAVTLGGGTSNVSNSFISNNLFFIRLDVTTSDNYVGIALVGEATQISHNRFLNQKASGIGIGVGGTETAIAIADPASGQRDANIVVFNTVTNFTDGFVTLASGTNSNLVAYNLPIGVTPEIADSAASDVNHPNVVIAYQGKAPPSVASALTITIPPGFDAVRISGAANIDTITPTYGGHRVTLIWGASATAKLRDQTTNSGNVAMAAATDFTGTGSDTVTIVCSNTGSGAEWFEVCRSVN